MSVVTMIVFKVVPQFKSFYEEVGHGHQLPLSTRFVVAFSSTLIDHSLLVLGVVAGLVVLVAMTLRRREQRKRLHAFILKLPWAGPLARKVATAQICRTLATLLAGGIPLVNAIEISSTATGNLSLSEHLGVVTRQVREGRSLANALTRAQDLPERGG